MQFNIPNVELHDDIIPTGMMMMFHCEVIFFTAGITATVKNTG